MATQIETEFELGFTDKRRVPGSTTALVGAPLTYTSIATLDAALTTANAGYYTAARLASLSKNDKIYGLRLANDAAGV